MAILKARNTAVAMTELDTTTKLSKTGKTVPATYYDFELPAVLKAHQEKVIAAQEAFNAALLAEAGRVMEDNGLCLPSGYELVAQTKYGPQFYARPIKSATSKPGVLRRK